MWTRRVDDVGNTLSCLYIHKTEVLLRRQSVRHVTQEYETECRVLFKRRDPLRNDSQETLGDRFAELWAGKPGGGVSLFCSPALKVAAVKLLEEMVAAAGATHGTGVAVVVAAEEGAAKTRLTRG